MEYFMMKAIVIKEHGGPDKLRVEDVPEPKYTENEVVLKVHSAGLNHLDIWVRKGGRLELPKPHIPGSDAAGVVVAAGANVKNVSVGKVLCFWQSPFPCAQDCRRDVDGYYCLLFNYSCSGTCPDAYPKRVLQESPGRWL